MNKLTERYTKIKHRSEYEKENYIKRLNRIEGQIRGINKMVEEDRYCADVLIQISAATKALKSLGEELLENHMKTCMIEDINNKDYESIDEVMSLFRKLV